MKGFGIGPNGMRHMEQSMRAVQTLPLDQQGKVELIRDCRRLRLWTRAAHVGVDGLGHLLIPRAARSITKFTASQIATGDFPLFEALLGDGEPVDAFYRVAKWMEDGGRFDRGLEAMPRWVRGTTRSEEETLRRHDMTFGTRGAVEDDYESFVSCSASWGFRIPTPTARPIRRAAHAADDRRACRRHRHRLRDVARVWHDRTRSERRRRSRVAWSSRRPAAARADTRARRSAGCTRWYLNVKADNTPAIRLYERCGFAIDKESWALSIPWSAALAIPFDPGLATALVRPEDEAEVAERFRHERRTHRCVLARARPDPSWLPCTPPTGRPGRVRRVRPSPSRRVSVRGAPARSRRQPLACVPRYADLATFDFIRLTVEGNRPLYEGLIASGATLTFAMLQLASPL